ncbi:MAG: hypothetical protein ACHQXA_04585 [Gemmatimonadales bacterium]
MVAGALALLLVGVVIYKVLGGVNMPARPDASLANGGVGGLSAGPGVPTGRAPDISNMTPKERFARLNDHVMQAAERSDTATVVNFTPMALGAYAQLPSPDVDDRYHAAILRAQIGDAVGALSLADTIARTAPGNLFAPIVRGTVAEFQGDTKARTAAFTDFLRHYDAESKKSRPEYLDHKPLIDAFKLAADSAMRAKS